MAHRAAFRPTRHARQCSTRVTCDELARCAHAEHGRRASVWLETPTAVAIRIADDASRTLHGAVRRRGPAGERRVVRRRASAEIVGYHRACGTRTGLRTGRRSASAISAPIWPSGGHGLERRIISFMLTSTESTVIRCRHDHVAGVQEAAAAGDRTERRGVPVRLFRLSRRRGRPRHHGLVADQPAAG